MIVPWPLQKDNKYLVMRTKRFLELIGNRSEGQERQHLMEEQNEEEAAA